MKGFRNSEYINFTALRYIFLSHNFPDLQDEASQNSIKFENT